jgi:hypothetical protein
MCAAEGECAPRPILPPRASAWQSIAIVADTLFASVLDYAYVCNLGAGDAAVTCPNYFVSTTAKGPLASDNPQEMFVTSGARDVFACKGASGYCNPAGPPVVTDPSGSIAALALTPSRLFWLATDGVHGCARSGTCDGGAPHLGGDFRGVAAGGGFVYATRPLTGEVVACPEDGCTSPQVIASGQSGPREIAADGVAVYWIDSTPGVVMSCPHGPAPCTPRVVTKGTPGAVKLLALTQKDVVFADSDALFRAPKR